MDFESTRYENDEKLLPQITSIQSAGNIKVLIPFAKAYLGMFYVIDKNIEEKEKIKLLANNKLAEAILSGFLSSLKLNNLPSIEDIGHEKAEQKEFGEGYVILAGLDLVAKKSLTNVNKVNHDLIEKAIGFHFSNKSNYHDIWFDYLLSEHKSKVADAISKYWGAMLKNKTTYLPGNNLILSDKPDIEIVEKSILLILENWSHCKNKTLSQLLLLAFKYSDLKEFMLVCERVLEKSEELNERAHLYWLSTAYLMSPDKYATRLSSYVGRVKLKIMPLLDFMVLIMLDKKSINLNAKILVQLLRMIAPVFPPQHHVYGAIGALDINSKNVMLIFYQLILLNDENVDSEVKSLRKARVMKIYSAVIDNLLDLFIKKNNKENFSLPSFDQYIEMLIKNNCLQSRSNKFDIR